MDPIDAQLLNLLQDDCSRSLATMGERVGLSVSAVKDRLRKLRDRGDVRAYVALVNPRTLGYTICAFVQVAVEGKKNEEALVTSLLKLPEIQECHHVSGEFPYLLKIWVADLQHLERFIDDHIKSRLGFLRVQTSVVFSSAKDQVTGLNARP